MTRYLHLEDHTGRVSADELTVVADAMTEQMVDLGRAWHLRHTVVTAARQAPHSWPIRIVEQSQAGLGVHLDAHGHPYAEVSLTPDWPMTASHEACEMRVDPLGRRFERGHAPDGSSAWLLVEVCDPPEAVGVDYGGITLSDFIGPGWYGHPGIVDMAGRARPGEILPGGYLSWIGADGRWHQAFAGPDGSLQFARSDVAARHAGDLRAEKDAVDWVPELT